MTQGRIAYADDYEYNMADVLRDILTEHGADIFDSSTIRMQGPEVLATDYFGDMWRFEVTLGDQYRRAPQSREE